MHICRNVRDALKYFTTLFNNKEKNKMNIVESFLLNNLLVSNK